MALEARKIQLAKPVSLLEEEKAQKELDKKNEQITFGDALSAAFAEDNTMSWLYNQLDGHEPDPDFFLNDELYDEYTKDIPEQYHNFVEDAVSLPHLEKLRDRVLQSMKNEEILAGYGWASVPLRLGAAIADPGAITASIITEGVAAPLIWGAKATRLTRAFRGMMTGGIASAGVESYLVSQNAIKDPYDILYAGAGGALLGGAIGTVLGRESDELISKALKNTMDDADKKQAASLKQAIINKNIAKDEDFVEGTSTIGAMEAADSNALQQGTLKNKADLEIEEVSDTPMSTLGKWRLDMVGRLKSSILGTSRYFVNFFGEDAVSGGEFTADLIKTKLSKTYAVNFYNIYADAYTGWAKANKIGYAKRIFHSRRAEFGRLVADEIEFPGSSTNEFVIKAAQRQRTLFRDLLREAKRANVKGFEDIPEDLTYFTHLWDASKFTMLRSDAKIGQKGVIQLLQNSLLRANPDLTEDIAKKMATGMSKNIEKRGIGIDTGLSRMFSTSNKETLKEILLEEDIVSEAEADSIINLLKFDREGVIGRAKKRLKFDVNYSEVFKGKEISVKDLMNRDAESVYNVYLNQLSGRIAFAQKGIRSDADLKKITDRIKEEGASLGEKGIKQAEKDVLKFNVMYDLILGRPPKDMIANPGSETNRMIRLLMDYNFIRVMNQVGFAQIAELGNAVSIDGVKGLIRVLPDFKKMITRAKNGELEDAVLRDLERFAGIGADRRIHQHMNRYDAHDIYVDGRGDFIDKAGLLAQAGKRITADLSMMAPITAALERAAARIATQSLVDIAFGIKKINFKKIGRSSLQQDIAKRMESLGLDADMAQQVFDQIKKHAVTTPSVFFKARKLRQINLDQWTNIEARDAFLLAITRWTRQSIQQNDVGNLNVHMTGTMGKILTQFRTFMLVSYSKQFLHNIRRNDFAAYSAMMYSSLFASLSYVAQMQANSIGRADRDEFLEERLSATEIGKAAFQRSSWASLFPALIDTGLPFFGEDPAFSYGRTTGLATGLISGIPAVQLLDTTFRGVQGVSRALLNDDYQISQSQIKALQSLVPFQNAIGIRNVMQIMYEDFPIQSKIE